MHPREPSITQRGIHGSPATSVSASYPHLLGKVPQASEPVREGRINPRGSQKAETLHHSN